MRRFLMPVHIGDLELKIQIGKPVSQPQRTDGAN